MRPRLPLLTVASAVLFVLTSRAAEVPYLSGRVNDLAGLLSSSTRTELESLLKSHEDSTSNQVVVLTIPGLEGESLEEYSIKVAETWKLGQKGKDNGVLLLVARDDRKVRIEVGRGLEGDLTDQTCGMIIRHEILPHFRDGDFDAGVRAGVTAILAAIRGSYRAEEHNDDLGIGGRILVFLLFLVVVGLFTLIALFSKGFVSWFLFVFLLPFWGTFPWAILGPTAGFPLLGMYVVGFIVFKIWTRNSVRGEAFVKRVAGKGFLAGATRMGWSSSGWSSSSGGGFSGGGGSFGGGGSSGGW